MDRNKRRTLFILITVVFFIVSYITLLYAQGYKYSFKDNKFIRTGALYLKTNTDADVFLNGKPIKRTSFFGSSVSIGGLLPGNYSVKASRVGYSSWQKVVTIQEGLLSDYSRILLLSKKEEDVTAMKKGITLLLYPTPSLTPNPTPSKTAIPNPRRPPTPPPAGGPTPSPSVPPTSQPATPFSLENGFLTWRAGGAITTIASSALDYSVSPDNKKLLWWNTYEAWVYWLDNTNYQPHHQKGDTLLINRFSAPIKKGGWYPDDDYIVIDAANYFTILEIDTRGGVNSIRL